MKALETIETFLRDRIGFPSLTALSKDEEVMKKSDLLIRIFYACGPFMAFLFLIMNAPPVPRQNFDPLWALQWVTIFHLDVNTTAVAVGVLFVVASMLALLWYKERSIRALFFFAVWQVTTYDGSFGVSTHIWYPWLFVSFILIFLPDGSRTTNTDKARTTLLVIWWAQAYMMLLYSMAGFWKFFIGFGQLFQGEISNLSPYGFPYQVAWSLNQIQNQAPFGPFFIEHPYIVWPLYIGSSLFQFFALWTMVRPRLQLLWGFELITFHTMTFLVLGTNFYQFIPIVIVLFCFSPFVPERVTATMVLYDLPLVGWALRRWRPTS